LIKELKSGLEARPAFVSTYDHIAAHILTCFVALVMSRILEMEMEMDHKHSITT
jgi:transposase